MNRWLRRGLILAGIVLVVVVLRLTVFRPAPVPVTVHEVGRGRVAATVVNSRAGTVHSRSEAELSAALSGLVEQIPVSKGSRVEKGQLLLRINDAEYRADVNTMQRAFEAAQSANVEADARVRQAERTYERHRQLVQGGFESDERLDDLETAREVATAAAATAAGTARQRKAALEAAQAVLAKTRLVAPFSGVLADVSTEVGEWISPSIPGIPVPPVMRLVDLDNLYVRAPIDEVDAGKIRGRLPVQITLDAFAGRVLRGHLSWISPIVETKEEQNRTLDVEAQFEGEDLTGVLPGLSADLEIILQERDDVLRIPTYSLMEGGKVLRLRGNTLEEVQVQTGLRNWQFTEVTAGLAAGDQIVVSLDRAEVTAGAKVAVEPESSP